MFITQEKKLFNEVVSRKCLEIFIIQNKKEQDLKY